MLVCQECGREIHEDDETSWYESRGEYWGTPCAEKVSGCPYCGGELVKKRQCVICGQETVEQYIRVCDDCLSDYENIENCLEIGVENAIEIKLNEFFTFTFTNEEIEEILLEHLSRDKEKMTKAIKDYCECDKSYFADWVEEKWKKGK